MDWKKLKAEYIAGGISYRELAKKHGASFNTLKTIAIREKWTELRQQADNKATTKIIETVVEESTNYTASINEVADKLLNKIEEMLDVEAITSQSVRHLTSALKDIKDIKGVKSEIDLREQEARIDKLRKEIDADKVDDDKPYGIVMMPPIMPNLSPPGEDNNG